MSRRPNFAQAHRKLTQQSEMSKSRPSAASSSLPVLKFSKFGPTNYISWSEVINTHCIREYGLLAACLQTAQYPAIAEVQEPTDEEIAADESGLVNFRYQYIYIYLYIAFTSPSDFCASSGDNSILS